MSSLYYAIFRISDRGRSVLKKNIARDTSVNEKPLFTMATTHSKRISKNVTDLFTRGQYNFQTVAIAYLSLYFRLILL